MVKVFSSNHRFRKGKLVYSSSQEILPDGLPKFVKKTDYGYDGKTSKSVSATNNSKAELQKTCIRKKMVDMMHDIGKQKVVRYYESSATAKMPRHIKSASSVDTAHLITENNKQRCVHTLNTQYPASQCLIKSTPNMFPYNRLTSSRKSKFALTHPKKSLFLKVSGTQPPTETVAKSSKRDMEIKNIFTHHPDSYGDIIAAPSFIRSKDYFKNQLEPPEESDIYQVMKSEVKYPVKHQAHPESCADKKRFISRPPALEKTAYSDYEHQYVKLSTCDSNLKNGTFAKIRSNHGLVKSHQKSPFKYLIKGKSKSSQQDNFSKYDSLRKRHEKSVQRQIDAGDASVKYEKHPTVSILKESRYQKSDRNESTAHKRKENALEGEVIGETKQHIVKDMPPQESLYTERDKMPDRHDGSTVTTGFSSETLPFCPASDLEIKMGHQKGMDIYNKSMGSKQCKKLEENGSILPNQPAEMKHDKTWRLINPDKVIHFEDTGRRLSQYYSSGKATLDSRKAFREEEKSMEGN